LIVPLIGVLILAGIIVYIVPKYKEIFRGFDTELPWLTHGVINFSDDHYSNPLWVVGIALLTALLFSSAAAYCRGWGENNIPLAGRWFRRLDVPGVLRILAATIASGGALDKTLAGLAGSHRRSAMRKALHRVHGRCSAGSNCWDAMHAEGLLTRRELTLLNSAERVGNLPWVMPQLAETIEQRIAYRWIAVAEFAQPALVLLLGLGVGILSVAFFLPLMKLVNDLS
jgi:type IV pilus assembly protein PilC